MQHLAIEEGRCVAGKPQRVLRAPHLVARLADGLADLRRDGLSQFLGVGRDALGEGVEERAALKGRRAPERVLGPPRPPDGSRDVVVRRSRDFADQPAVIGAANEQGRRRSGYANVNGLGHHSPRVSSGPVSAEIDTGRVGQRSRLSGAAAMSGLSAATNAPTDSAQ